MAQCPNVEGTGNQCRGGFPVWFGWTKGMDPAVVKKLHDAFKKALDDPETDKILNKLDMVYLYKNTEEYNKQVRALFEEEKELVEKLGLKKN